MKAKKQYELEHNNYRIVDSVTEMNAIPSEELYPMLKVGVVTPSSEYRYEGGTFVPTDFDGSGYALLAGRLGDELHIDTITEQQTDHGVAIEDVILKDGGVQIAAGSYFKFGTTAEIYELAVPNLLQFRIANQAIMDISPSQANYYQILNARADIKTDKIGEYTLNAGVTLENKVYATGINGSGTGTSMIYYDRLTGEITYGDAPGSGTGADGVLTGVDTSDITAVDFTVTGAASVLDVDFSHTHVIADIIDFTDNHVHWDTAYSWGDHAGLYDVTGTAASAISTHESTYNHTHYDTAYSWGDHAGLYLLLTGGTLTGTVSFNDTNTQIWEDGSGNLTFKDTYANTKTLSELASVETTSPLGTKGDIWVYSTPAVALGVGSDTPILIAASPAADGTGLKWITDPYQGTVTSVTAGNGMSFAEINGSGPVILGTPSDCTLSTANTLTSTSHTHNLDIASFGTSGIPGLVPLSPGGSDKFLRADSSWAIPPGGSADGYLSGVDASIITSVNFTMTNAFDVTGIDFSHAMSTHSDVNIPGLVQDDILKFNGVEWINVQIPGGYQAGYGININTGTSPDTIEIKLDGVSGLVTSLNGLKVNFGTTAGTVLEGSHYGTKGDVHGLADPSFAGFMPVLSDSPTQYLTGQGGWNTPPYLTGVSFSTSTGVITHNVYGKTDITVDIDGRYLQLGGGTMTGDISMNGTTVYVDNIEEYTSSNGVHFAGSDVYFGDDAGTVTYLKIDNTTGTNYIQTEDLTGSATGRGYLFATGTTVFGGFGASFTDATTVGVLYMGKSATDSGVAVYLDGATQIQYDGAKKFETTTLGVKVTGEVEVTNSVKVDTISEYGSGNGVTIDGLLIQDGDIDHRDFKKTPQSLSTTSGTVNWDIDLGHNATISLTEASTVTLVNEEDGDSGFIEINTAGTGYDFSLSGATLRGAGGDTFPVSIPANKNYILSYVIRGVVCYWSILNYG